MSNKDGSGAAFPSAGVVIDYDKNEHQQGAYEGMSLRDYFAAKAANGLCANHSWLQETFNTVGGDEAINVVARASYELADAMLLERAK